MGTRSGSWRCRAAGSTTPRAAFSRSGSQGTGGAWWRRWWTSAIPRRRAPTTSWMRRRPCGMRSGWLLGIGAI
ncbi:unnamed protein product [Linum tenue]|uniref:Uncharacterized protein n=1 Tax=Linum tenue TaxID=586396 RepID=A0AAV0IGL5_9ROSI|nr:unnamed protein product [Linum tenue]